MSEKAKETKGKCFVVTPIGAPNSPVRRNTDGLLNSVLEPVLKGAPFNFIVKAAHQESEGGSITRSVIQHLLEDDLVVADLTGLNPNVMYEVAVRHAIRKPIVLLTQDLRTLPFDIADQRTLEYVNDLAGVKELQETLRELCSQAMKEESPDNPIARVANKAVLQLGEHSVGLQNLFDLTLKSQSDISRLANVIEKISLRQEAEQGVAKKFFPGLFPGADSGST